MKKTSMLYNLVPLLFIPLLNDVICVPTMFYSRRIQECYDSYSGGTYVHCTVNCSALGFRKMFLPAGSLCSPPANYV
jgi:hypothetical protein